MQDRLGPVIGALDERARRRVLETAAKRCLLRDEILFLTGDEPERVHVITSGVVKLAARARDGSEAVLGLAFEGDLVGDLRLLDGRPQPHDAIATTQCTLMGFGRRELETEVRSNAHAALAMSLSLARRVRWMSGAVLERSSGRAPARLAGRLLDLAEAIGSINGNGIDMELPLRQGDLARMAGMCRESACKTLRAFKQQGLLDYRGTSYRIIRPDVLAAIRCAGRGAAPSRSADAEDLWRSPARWGT